MKIYLSTAYEGKAMITLVAKQLRNLGFQVVSSWHDEPGANPESFQAQTLRTRKDIKQIKGCDVLVSFYPYGDGTAAEIGVAVGLGKKVMYVCTADHHGDLPWVAYADEVALCLPESCMKTLLFWDELFKERPNDSL